MQPLEGDQRADQRARLAGLDARRQEKQQRVEIVLLRHDAVLAQILRHDRRRDAMGLVVARGAVEAGRQQRQLVRIGDGEALPDVGKAVPGRARLQFPELRLARQGIGGDALPGHFVDAAILR